MQGRSKDPLEDFTVGLLPVETRNRQVVVLGNDRRDRQGSEMVLPGLLSKPGPNKELWHLSEVHQPLGDKGTSRKLVLRSRCGLPRAARDKRRKFGLLGNRTSGRIPT